MCRNLHCFAAAAVATLQSTKQTQQSQWFKASEIVSRLALLVLSEHVVMTLSYRGEFPVRFAHLKLAVLSAFVLVGLALVPAASADSITFALTKNNLGISGSLGTVKVTDLSGGGVSVSITMASGYGVFMNNQNGKGGKLFVTTSGSLT